VNAECVEDHLRANERGESHEHAEEAQRPDERFHGARLALTSAGNPADVVQGGLP
jgi:hypothetical protein